MFEPEKFEKNAGIAPERTGNGTFDDGWEPGDEDPNTERVHDASAEGNPGIAPAEEIDLIG